MWPKLRKIWLSTLFLKPWRNRAVQRALDLEAKGLISDYSSKSQMSESHFINPTPTSSFFYDVEDFILDSPIDLLGEKKKVRSCVGEWFGNSASSACVMVRPCCQFKWFWNHLGDTPPVCVFEGVSREAEETRLSLSVDLTIPWARVPGWITRKRRMTWVPASSLLLLHCRYNVTSCRKLLLPCVHHHHRQDSFKLWAQIKSSFLS